jgi:Tol biopolymer transport system component
MNISTKVILIMIRKFSFAGLLLIALLSLTGCMPTGLSLEQHELLPALETKKGLIVYIGEDGNIYTIDQAGGKKQAITTDAQTADVSQEIRFYRFPAWAPGSQRVAYVSITGSGQEISEVAIYAAELDGSDQVKLFSSVDEIPVYLYWSPNGRFLSFIASALALDEITLQVVPSQGGEAQILGKSSSLYWDWSPDNQSILMHLGGAAKVAPEAHLMFKDLDGQSPEKKLDLLPTFFQAPAWAPSGEELLLAAETGDGEEALVLTDRNGAQKKVIATIEGSVAFDWSPDGERLAYISNSSEEGDGEDKRLTFLDPNHPERAITTSGENVLAFFWAPNSQRIAYFTPLVVSPEEDPNLTEPVLLLTMHVLEVRSGDSHEVATFIPTEQMFSLLSVFDQYQRSSTFWSPDSKNLVIAAMNTDGTPGIYIAEASGNLKTRYITDGDLAFWSSK